MNLKQLDFKNFLIGNFLYKLKNFILDKHQVEGRIINYQNYGGRTVIDLLHLNLGTPSYQSVCTYHSKSHYGLNKDIEDDLKAYSNNYLNIQYGIVWDEVSCVKDFDFDHKKLIGLGLPTLIAE